MKPSFTILQNNPRLTEIAAGITGLILGSLVGFSLIPWGNVTTWIVGGP